MRRDNVNEESLSLRLEVLVLTEGLQIGKITGTRGTSKQLLLVLNFILPTFAQYTIFFLDAVFG